MSILDSILSQVTGGSQSNPLTKVVLDMVTHPSGGGLAGLVQQFTSAGLGQQAASWVGTEANQAITADHIKQVFGNEKVQQIAQQIGIDPNQAASQLATLIPQVVDKLTPNGQMVHGDDLKNSIAGLVQSFLSKPA